MCSITRTNGTSESAALRASWSLRNVAATVPKAGEEPTILPGKRHGQDNVYAMCYSAELPEMIKKYPESRLRLRVFARDGVSHVGKVFSHEFLNSLISSRTQRTHDDVANETA